jgi:hypothetical protein
MHMISDTIKACADEMENQTQKIAKELNNGVMIHPLFPYFIFYETRFLEHEFRTNKKIGWGL